MSPDNIFLVEDSTTSTAAPLQQGLYDGTSDTDNMYYYHTSNTAEPEIELPEIPTPKQTFERPDKKLKPKRRTVGKRARSMKFTQARVRRA